MIAVPTQETAVAQTPVREAETPIQEQVVAAPIQERKIVEIPLRERKNDSTKKGS